jgi:hypothetical protein
METTRSSNLLNDVKLKSPHLTNDSIMVSFVRWKIRGLAMFCVKALGPGESMEVEYSMFVTTIIMNGTLAT